MQEQSILLKVLELADISVVTSEQQQCEMIRLVALGEHKKDTSSLILQPDLIISFCKPDQFSSANIEVLFWPGSEWEFARMLRAWFSPPISHSAIELNMIGDSQSLRDLLTVIERISKSEAPVFVQGETGTGKEVAARAIHYLGARNSGPFVALNCGAYNDDLFIGELFGYERGAFTDAKKTHVGFVEQAEKGTLFLDEIDSLSPKAQVALLRFLQDKEYRPLGSSSSRHANVRLIAASNKSRAYLLSGDYFREDLFYRLDILSVNIPPLRERAKDISVLSQHFLKRLSRDYLQPTKTLSPRTLDWMYTYSWPGNIRELENYLHKLFVLSESNIIDVVDIKGIPSSKFHNIHVNKKPVFPIIFDSDDKIEWSNSFQVEKAKFVEKFERHYIESLLQKCSGNISKAARLAGKERRSFARLLEKHSLDNGQYRSPDFSSRLSDNT
jgi:DNA-binding NtrC family response regulator